MTETSNHPAVEILNLRKVFRDFWQRPTVTALNGITMDVKEGEVFGLLGPNGSGKSTTIKILLGLLHPSSGTVKILGREPTDVAAKKEIGYLPEESYLYQYLTPAETLDFYARLFGIDRHTRGERSKQLLEMVGLSHAAHRPVGGFSKGMSRRIGIAQALINDPRLVFLDEPTPGLDPIGCRQVKDLIRTLAGRGKTIVLSSHLLADVEDVCDRIAILYNGEIRAHGRVRELLETSEHLSLTIPVLPPDRLAAVLKSLRALLGSEPEVGRPSMNLEQFFLKVVEEAHQRTPEPSGTGRTEGVAQYLSSHD